MTVRLRAKHLAVEDGNGMGKTYQCKDNGKLGNNDQNQQKKYNLRSRKVNDMLVIASQMMSILNV